MDYLLHHCLQSSATARPDHPAVVDKSGVLSYAELDARSNRLAHLLRTLGVSPGDRVGLYLEKSADAIVGIYGTLKTGAAYVPLDPQSPAERLAYIVRDCGLECLLTAADKARQWPRLPAKTFVVLDKTEHAAREGAPPELRVVGRDALEAQPASAPTTAATDRDLAYILYTSGSTGRPKGVMLSHRNGLAFAKWVVDEFGINDDDRVSNHAPLHFDLSILDVFASSIAGATVVLVPRTTTIFPVELVRFIDRQRITVWYSVPSALSMIVQRGNVSPGDLGTLRLVFFAGEVFPTKYLRELTRLLPNARFVNLYGPTETNVCTWYDVSPLADDETEPVPIGTAIAGVDVFAVTDDGRPASPGEVGELHVRGPTVMQGYWGDLERTARALVTHPFVRDARDAVYRTGDLVRLEQDGNYRFLGRRDAQIKSRGYRIELGDIEAALNANPDVVECAVVAVPDDLVTNRLAAAVVTRNVIAERDLAASCSKMIPSYMVPEVFDVRDRLPRTSTGKVDRTRIAAELGTRIANPNS
jgi:amino acid adenylation domain-containing protein